MHNKQMVECGYSHLGGSALSLIGNLAGKAVATAIKSESGRTLLKQVGKTAGTQLLKDAKGQAVSMAHSHVDNLAKAVHEKTGIKVDTTDLKNKISERATQIKLGGQLGGGYKQYGAGFPLQLIGSIAGKLVNSAAKSGVANQLVKAAQANASSIGKNMVAQAQQQAVNMAQQQIDKIASEVQQQTGLKVDTSGLKQQVQQKTSSFF
jgi:cell division septum initiation protein DivIVA